MAKTSPHTFVGDEGEPRHAAIDAALDYMASRYQRQPSLDEIARVAGMSPYHFQRTFRAWTGVTPKRFMQYLQLGKAKDLLIEEHSLMTTALDVGLSGTSRLHDLFISCEAVTPGEFKTSGRGLVISYGIHDSPFGRALIGATDRGICWLGFVAARRDARAVRELEGDWPGARLVHDPARIAPLAEHVFARARTGKGRGSLRLDLRGTNFQIKVWEALLKIPFGRLATYQDVAAAIGDPQAARAVGGAVGANPISLVIPCHRVILKSGIIHNYRWGVDRKRTILALEQAHESERDDA
jgi:AraC family transcriptional regulator, regulatory protein of adaptative response / methylated-DNA-[protein]-cysteine methyltransferase